ncbi:MAG: hypothetical protein HGA51_01840, partial [Demequinaceae bacterium]|nr:hypothetical protein [Demequinaceae bacterium]
AYFSGDCETYVDLTTATARANDGFPGTCAEVTEGFFPDVDATSFSVNLGDVEITGSTATVAGTITSDEFGDGSMTYYLVKVDGEWKVDSIE